MMASGVLRASLLCVLATLVWAQDDDGTWSPGGNDIAPSEPAVRSNVSCEDTEGKHPACTGTCPVDCPQQCLVSCPGCVTFCRPDQARPSAKQTVRPPWMFIFGDGNVDVGNGKMMALTEWERPADETPFEDLPESVRTDGDNTAQFIAKFMGFQRTPPASLMVPRRIRVDQGFIGINYACTRAWLRDPYPGSEDSLTVPMVQQLRQFAETIAQVVEKLGAPAVKDLLAKSFFLIEVGGVDLSYGLSEVQDLLPLYGDAIKSLYNMGARRFGLINVGLIGNAPLRQDVQDMIMQGIGRQIGPADMNKRAAEFNARLKPLLAGLAKSLSGLRYSIADMHTLTETVFADPSAYGFEDIRYPCDHYGEECYNPAEVWYWDDNGITQHAANLAATAFFYGPPQFTAPVIFRSLLDTK